MADPRPQEEARPELGDASTVRPVAPPEPRCGTAFQPLHLPDRPHRIHPLPDSPLKLFQLFFTVEIAQKWAGWTNATPKNGPWKRQSREVNWKPVTMPEIFIFLAAIIYMELHPQNDLKTYWEKAANKATHIIPNFITRDRFLSIYSHLRTWNPDTKKEVFRDGQCSSRGNSSTPTSTGT
jgi:hypothetical protein